jgi:hypothetical protein
MENIPELVEIYAAMDEDSRTFYLAIGRAMAAKQKRKRPPESRLSSSGNPKPVVYLVNRRVNRDSPDVVPEPVGK